MGELFDRQTEYLEAEFSRFHTPGHSGKGDALPQLAQALPYDVTEVENFDSLYHAHGAIRRSEERLSRIFGSKATLISCGGCTLAIQAMLALALKPGDKILMGRNAHRSAISAAALLDLDPVWVYPQADGVVTSAQIEAALSNESGIAALYLTSPNYYGQLCDIKAISEITKKREIPLLVDNAHGSHLRFLREDIHPIALGADMTACSVHKTLPVLTGGALLNIANEKFIPLAKEKMALFGSTSPSYLTMATIDLLCDRAQELYGKFADLQDTVENLRNHALSRGIPLPEGDCDPVRFTLHTGKCGISGEEAYRIFKQNGCVAEMYDDEYIVFILTPFHNDVDISRLHSAVDKLTPRECESSHLPPFPKSSRAISVRDAVFSEKERVSLSDAPGRIAADSVTPCPPGIPVIIPGELITRETVEYLKNKGYTSVEVVK